MTSLLKPRRILWRIFPAFIFLSLLTLCAMTWYATHFFGKIAEQRAIETLRQESTIIEPLIRNELFSEDYDRIDSLAKEMGHKTARRFTVILPDGRVIGDSTSDPKKMENHKGRSEIAAALAGQVGVSKRYSRTTKENLIYVAIPIQLDGAPIAVVRAAESASEMMAAIRVFYARMLSAGLIILLIASVGCYWLYNWLTHPLEVLRDGIERFAGGQLQHRIDLPTTAEMGDLARAVNRMAAQLDERFQSLHNERIEKETILASLSDGILVLDPNESILTMNAAAAAIFGISGAPSGSPKLAELVRNSALIDLVRTGIQSKIPRSREVIFRHQSEGYFQVDFIPIKDSYSFKKYLLVFHNLTAAKRSQNARLDLVTQVSHQLKVPTAALLQIGDDLSGRDPQSASGILAATKVITTILNDLIYLIQFEQSVEAQKLELSVTDIASVVHRVVEMVDDMAQFKSIAIILSGVGNPHARLNVPSFEQALLQLLKNSVFYTPSGGEVRVTITPTDTSVLIHVEDTGIGIPADALDHIFKPFYRINTPDHQKVSGGGLGLAIVKAVVTAHEGTIRVTTTMGHGTRFEIELPIYQGGTDVLSA
ncbi:HAMP domain-containing protein [bacterium]|nr:HAMP domain-containing protein [bacterium]